MWISLTLFRGNLTPGPSPGQREEEFGKELVLNDNF